MNPILTFNIEDVIEEDHYLAVERGVNYALEKSKELLDLGTLRLDVWLVSNPESQFSAYASNKEPQTVSAVYNCARYINPGNLATDASVCIAHELHHMVRKRKTPMRENIFGETFIAEGMADCFVKQVGHERRITLPRTVIDRLCIRALHALDRPYSYNDWFLAIKPKTLFLTMGVINWQKWWSALI